MLNWGMAQPAPKRPIDLATETGVEREARLTWERTRLAEADADFAAGRYISGDEADAWLARELAEAQAASEREDD